ncbi:MAG: hypothetical protein NT023_20590 [Armatimonadetes bacterium]|nr:hypothetical protein [Armatimonadota bacterium]
MPIGHFRFIYGSCLDIASRWKKLPTAAAGTPLALRGIKRFYILVEELQANAKNVDLSDKDIEGAVELRMLEAGVKLATRDEWLHSQPGTVSLYVNLNSVATTNAPLLAYHLEVQVQSDGVFTHGGRQTKVFGATVWRRFSTGFVGTSIAKENIISNVREQVERFLLDYLKANPKN